MLYVFQIIFIRSSLTCEPFVMSRAAKPSLTFVLYDFSEEDDEDEIATPRINTVESFEVEPTNHPRKPNEERRIPLNNLSNVIEPHSQSTEIQPFKHSTAIKPINRSTEIKSHHRQSTVIKQTNQSLKTTKSDETEIGPESSIDQRSASVNVSSFVEVDIRTPCNRRRSIG